MSKQPEGLVVYVPFMPLDVVTKLKSECTLERGEKITINTRRVGRGSEKIEVAVSVSVVANTEARKQAFMRKLRGQ